MSEAVCPECNGTGYKIVERDEVSGAVRCGCVSADRAARLESEANIPSLYENSSFESFLLTRDNPMGYRELTDVFLKVRAYARAYPTDRKRGLLLMGEPGVGKTHLAVAAFRQILAKGFEGRFFDYQQLLQSIRAGYDATSNVSDRAAYRTAMECEVLFLDDLGSHRTKDWIEDTITSIITHRCNAGKTLIATTNLADPEAGDTTYERSDVGIVTYKTTLIDRIGPRARSRLFEMCRVIKMPLVEDFRMRKSAPKPTEPN